MNISKRWMAGGIAAIAIVGAGGSVAMATGGDDNEEPITGEALQKVSAAALAHTGGGRVTDTEVGDEDSYYEVEVTLPNGQEVDVQLDKDFNVVSSETEGADEDEGANDD